MVSSARPPHSRGGDHGHLRSTIRTVWTCAVSFLTRQLSPRPLTDSCRNSSRSSICQKKVWRRSDFLLDFTAEIRSGNLTIRTRAQWHEPRMVCHRQIGGIVIGVTAMVTMLVACICLISFNLNEDVHSLGKTGGGSLDRNPDPPPIHYRPAELCPMQGWA